MLLSKASNNMTIGQREHQSRVLSETLLSRIRYCIKRCIFRRFLKTERILLLLAQAAHSTSAEPRKRGGGPTKQKKTDNKQVCAWLKVAVCSSYLCMISDVEANVFTVTDVAVLNGRTSTLATYTHCRAHCRETWGISIMQNTPKFKSLKYPEVQVIKMCSYNFTFLQ